MAGAGGRHTGFALHLAGDDEQGNGIGPGAENAVQGIDSAGAGGHVHYAGFSGDAGVAFRGHGAGLFVMVTEESDAGFATEGIVEVHGPAAGDHENVAHPPIRKFARYIVRKLQHA